MGFLDRLREGFQSGADSPADSIWHPNLIPPTLREIKAGTYQTPSSHFYTYIFLMIHFLFSDQSLKSWLEPILYEYMKIGLFSSFLILNKNNFGLKTRFLVKAVCVKNAISDDPPPPQNNFNLTKEMCFEVAEGFK